MEDHHIAPVDRSIEALYEVLTQRKPIVLSPDAKGRIEKCRNYLDAKLQNNDAPIYGINTGFGSLCDTRISNDDLGTLQRNLVLSHACGAGPTVPQEIVRWMLLLKARALSFGHSGVQLATVQRLLDLLNNNLIPVVYELGSLGASGDLAPLAHLSLPLIGEGQVWQSEGHKATKEVYWNLNWEPIQLKAKEGLALLNGTQFMSAYGCHLVMRARRLMKWADIIAAMSLEAFDGRIEPFGVEVNAIRRQAGQIEVAENMRTILAGSELIKQHKKHVQDPYSFRCIPQVHGASRDAIAYAGKIVENEINAVTDNPTIFPDQDMIVSAGNFHGQPLALALDNLAIALAELGSISERRTYKLISGQRDLPPFLVANPGLNSGFMIPQYTAASIVSQNKVLCHPASVDTIDSSNGQEDHVSMGANAATKAFRVGQNVQRIMAIELLNAAQALELRGADRTSPAVKKIYDAFRQKVGFVNNDTYLHPLMEKSFEFLMQEPSHVLED
ncbi:MAG: histidine ammonia-lyase [Cryomorphaceae bacterium]|nr:histidine ammonia-lyase [Cryomorphaceae bacterium]